MKIFLIILALFVFRVNVHGQALDMNALSSKLYLMLHDSTITGLTTTIEKIKTDKSTSIGNVWINDEFKGPLKGDVVYHQFELSLIVPMKVDGHDYWGAVYYMLEILSQGDQIIFKRRVDSKGEIIDFEFEEVPVATFIKTYEQTYSIKVELKYDELELYENGDFGVGCSISGDLPLRGKEMMSLVNKKQSQELMNWVKAISPLKKAYGVLGLYLLAKKGLKLSEEQKKLIALAKNETIEINTCTGCISGIKEPLNDLLTDKSLNEMYKILK